MRNAEDLLTLFLSRLHIAVITQKTSPQPLLALCLHHNVPGFFSHLDEAYPCSSELKYWSTSFLVYELLPTRY